MLSQSTVCYVIPIMQNNSTCIACTGIVQPLSNFDSHQHSRLRTRRLLLLVYLWPGKATI